MKKWALLAVGLAWLPIVASAQSAPDRSSVTGASISQDEMAVYEAVLSAWLSKRRGRQLVNEQLSAAPLKDDPDLKECTKDLDFSAPPQRVEPEKSLAGVRFKRNGIELIDGSKWKPADPERGVANGKSVEAAVEEGFSKSMISFSQIAFNSDGNDALVKFSMECGGLCGSGSTMHLHKFANGWVVVRRCEQWIS
jgi:hypothetical protein